MKRPRPAVVTPARQQQPIAAPEDAVVLFDGKDLSEWRTEDGKPAQWEVRDGAMVSVPDSGYLYSARAFGDIQLHVEWVAPLPVEGEGQGRGNSGVFLMSNYEVQVLDSYRNDTYPDGQAAAVYGQYPPLVNASRPPGEWQSYDIVFRRPRFHRDGGLKSPARITVLHNGILVQDNVELWGPTRWLQHLPYVPHADKLPLGLQDHGNPVRYRNIWLRELPEWDGPGPQPVPGERVVQLPPDVLARYAGQYQSSDGDEYTFLVKEGVLRGTFYAPLAIELIPRSRTQFDLRWTAARVVFDLDAQGQPTGLTFHIGRHPRKLSRVPGDLGASVP